MRKLVILTMLLLLVGCGTVSAESSLMTTATFDVGFLGKLNIGTYYDFNGKQLLVGGDLPFIGIRNWADVGIGALTTINKHAIPLASLDLNIQGITESVGLTYKFLDPLILGGFYAKDIQRLSEQDQIEYWGLSLTSGWNF